MNKIASMFNERNAAYNVCFSNGNIAILDAFGNQVDAVTAIKIGEQIIDRYSPICFVYVGRKNDFLKIGLSANLERRDQELDKVRFENPSAKYKRELHIACRNRSEAAVLEKSILDFLSFIRQSAGLDVGTEWFFYKDHDFTLISSVFELCDPPNAIKFFQTALQDYIWLKQHYSKPNSRSYTLLDYIHRHQVTAFKKHALIEFGFVEQIE
ncbi:MAG: GIY-YIG nuclease family protein [Chloroflexi bacterium]|nr:GIY-YIG nuclease family protein [Chloroflexota bacterium]MCC6896031.1 GIY-YIG nuclease family protein [Anaerolineae bacterium]